jgi:hypothetical protein
MSTYRFLAHDLRTNAGLGELPLSDVSYGEALNGVGQFRASIAKGAMTADIAAATTPERTAVYIERDGAIVGGAIIWQRQRSDAAAVAVSGAGWWSFFRTQHLRTELLFTATDQLLIARTLLNTAQAVTGANIGVGVGTETCGVLRDRSYRSWDLKQIAEAVEQLAAVENGFDFAVDTNTDRTKTFRLSYPRRGRIAGTTGIVFELGKNLLGYTANEDGTRSARTFTAIGSGDGRDMLIATTTRTDLIDAGYPLTSAVGSWKDVSNRSTIAAHATASVNARALTPTFWSVTVDPDDVDGGVGSFITGDDVLVRVPDDDNFRAAADGSPGYSRYHRVLDWTLNVPGDGQDTLTVTLGEAL